MTRATGDPRHLLIRAPNWVGDLVMATPILEAALADPRFERVTIAVRAHLADVLSAGPCEPALLRLERGGGEARALSSVGAGAALLLSNSLGAAWRAWRAGIPVRAGADLSGRGPLLTHRVVPPMRAGRRAPIPTAHLMRDVAGLLAIQVPSLRPRLHVGAGEGEASRAMLARAGLGEDRAYALCLPGAAFGAAKLWPPERFARALDELYRRRGLVGVVSGGPGEEPLIDAVAGRCRHPAVPLSGQERNLRGLKPLVAGARIILVGDSGPRWYAAAFAVPCVTVMGPNSPQLTASSLEWCEIVRLEDLPCSPCFERVCPLGHHRCMLELDPRRVVVAAERLLDRREGTPVVGV